MENSRHFLHALLVFEVILAMFERVREFFGKMFFLLVKVEWVDLKCFFAANVVFFF